MELASQANTEWVRLGLYCKDVERNPGEFDAQADDALIASARAIRRTSLTLTTGKCGTGLIDRVLEWSPTQFAAQLAFTSSAIKQIDSKIVVLGGLAFGRPAGDPAVCS